MLRRYWWSIDGQLAARGVDPLDLPFDRLLNLAYWWATKDAQDPDALADWEAELWRPPKGNTEPIPVESPWSAESETSAFAAFANEAGQGQNAAVSLS